jgi:polar amino acid transport system substrate-binding protein
LSPRTAAAALAVAALVITACTSTASPRATTSTGPQSSSAPTTSSSTTTSTTLLNGFHTVTPGVLTVGTERFESPWFIGADPSTVGGGFEYDLAKAIASRLGVHTVKVVPASLVLVLTGQECACDIMLSQIAVTDSRAQAVDFTEPYLEVHQAALVRAGTVIATLEQARALRWGVALRDIAGLDVINKRIQPTTTVDTSADEDQGPRLLAEGKLDAVLLDTPEALAVAGKDPSLAVAGQFRTGDEYAGVLPFGSSNTGTVNDIIRDLTDDGTIERMATFYFGIAPDKVPVIPS